MYTLSTLQEFNQYLREYKVQEQDLVIVNGLIEIFTRNLENLQPTPGDTIICHGYSDYKNETIVYPDGIIDEIENDKLHICVKPSNPYVLKDGRTSTSGGYWFRCDVETVKRTDELFRERTFWCWGRAGACARGGLHFRAKVKVWEVFSPSVY